MAKQIHVIGNIADFAEEEMVPQNDDNILVFVGKMSYEPNIVAVTNFVEYILPIIWKQKEDIKFYIVGAHPDKRVTLLHNGKNVIVTGYVDEVKEYFRKATLVVAPMITGAGIQNKIIQAMSLGCCVITTEIGAEGLDIRNNEIAVVGGNKEFAEKVIDLLEDKKQREKMGKEAKEYVLRNLSAEVIARQFDRFIQDIDRFIQDIEKNQKENF